MRKKLPAIPSRRERALKTGLLVAAALLLLAGALSVPFLFESPSIRYKFGFDKTLLRTGKIAGLAAAALLLFQPLLAARLKFFDRVFTLPGVWTLHRLNGYLIALLALLHPVLILWPEDFTLPPMALEYWPQAAGLLLLLLIGLQAVVSRWHQKFNIAFNRWRQVHRYNGGLIILLLVLHVLYVSETFADGLPRYALLAATGLCGLIFCAAGIRAWKTAKKRYVITAVKPENDRITTLEVYTGDSAELSYLPGQFAFIAVDADTLSSEPHPFTISSAPTQSGRLTFTIKNSGDWTARVKNIRKGDTLALNGPFGLFSHLICPPRQPLVLIAGGIGITPMLSMLRHMQATADVRQVRLLWSNRRADDLICRDELERIVQDLTGLTMVHIFTAEKVAGAELGRLDRPKLQRLLRDTDRSAAVFICGPPRMMTQAARDMQALGYQRANIHTEPFGL